MPGQNFVDVNVGELIIHSPPGAPPFVSERKVAVVSNARMFDPCPSSSYDDDIVYLMRECELPSLYAHILQTNLTNQ